MRLTTGANVICTWLMDEGWASTRGGGGASFRGCGACTGLGPGGAPAPGIAKKATAAMAATPARARDTVFIGFSLSPVTHRFNFVLQASRPKGCANKKGGISAAPGSVFEYLLQASVSSATSTGPESLPLASTSRSTN